MKHFKIFELVDRATYTKWGETAWSLIHPDLQLALDALRELFDAPMTANNYAFGGRFQYRGFRGPECKEGAPKSYHRRGMAVDFDVKGYTAEEARQFILAHKDEPLVDKIMRMEADVNWVHIDLGEIPEGKERIYVFKP